MKELEDLSWFPSVLRNYQTDFIGFVVARFNVYGVFIDHVKALLLPVQPMTDLCSGSGEPAISIFRKSDCFSHLLLTDKYPNTLKFQDDKITYNMLRADVLEMEFRQGTCYTMFNAFHHFTDGDKTRIAHRIQATGSRAFFVEILQPNIVCLLKVFLATTIGSLLLTPFLHPFSLKRLFFTYILPVNILAITYDGIVSVFKSRSVMQYQELFAGTEDTVKVIKLTNGWHPLVVIHIEPRK